MLLVSICWLSFSFRCLTALLLLPCSYLVFVMCLSSYIYITWERIVSILLSYTHLYLWMDKIWYTTTSAMNRTDNATRAHAGRSSPLLLKLLLAVTAHNFKWKSNWRWQPISFFGCVGRPFHRTAAPVCCLVNYWFIHARAIEEFFGAKRTKTGQYNNNLTNGRY